MARVVKAAGKQSWQMWKIGDGKTMHCNTGERKLAKMASQDYRRQEKAGPKQSKRPRGKGSS